MTFSAEPSSSDVKSAAHAAEEKEQVDLVTAAEIDAARARISAYVHRTPLLTNASIDEAASRVLEDALRALPAGADGREVDWLRRGAGGGDNPERKEGLPFRVRLHLAFKAEHLQKGGAFKARGATHAVLVHLERERERAKREGREFEPRDVWFVTHSSGNHAGALARAARSAGASAAVVMPDSTPAPKQAAVREYGARAVMCESTLAAREETARRVMEELEGEMRGKGAVVFVHPYDDPLVIAGQGTLGEIVEQGEALVRQGWGPGSGSSSRSGASSAASTNGRPAKCSAQAEAERPSPSQARQDGQDQSDEDEPPFDIVLSPVGGGGQLSGLSAAVKAADARIRVYGAEPEEADDAARSFTSHTLQPAISPPRSIADGLLTALSPRTYAHIRTHVDGILTTSETSILRALKMTWERTKQMIEPSACVGLGVVLQADRGWVDAVGEVVRRKVAKARSAQAEAGHGKDGDDGLEVNVRVVIVWTGGNVELAKVVSALERLASS